MSHNELTTRFNALDTALLGKSDSPHTHSQNDIIGLIGHSHTLSDITDASIAFDAKAPVVHTHDAADITGSWITECIMNEDPAVLGSGGKVCVDLVNGAIRL